MFNYTKDRSLSSLVYQDHGKEAVANISKIRNPLKLDLLSEKVRIDSIEPLNVQICYKRKLNYQDFTSLTRKVDLINFQNSTKQEKFQKASDSVNEYLREIILHDKELWIPSLDIVLECFKKRKIYHPSGKILVLNKKCPWKTYAYYLMKQGYPRIDFCVFKDGEEWVVQTLGRNSSYQSHKFLPSEWRGLSGLNLELKSGIKGAKYVHNNGHLGIAESRESALKMAEQSLV